MKKIVSIQKAISRNYGYTIYHHNRVAYLHDGHREGWYRYKKDAIKRATELAYMVI